MKIAGFFTEQLPDGSKTFSSGRLFGLLIICAAVYVILFFSNLQRNEIQHTRSLLTQTVRESTLDPIKPDSVILVTKERPVLTPDQYKDILKNIPGIPWEIVLGLLGMALTYLGYKKTQELSNSPKSTSTNETSF